MDVLANWLWQGSAVALAATVILRASRRMSATSRYQLWWVALCIVLVLPAFSFQLPAPSFQPSRSGFEQEAFKGQPGEPDSMISAGSWQAGAGSSKLNASSWKPAIGSLVLPAFPSWAVTLARLGVARLGDGVPVAHLPGARGLREAKLRRAPVPRRARGQARDLALAPRPRSARRARRVGPACGRQPCSASRRRRLSSPRVRSRRSMTGARSDRHPRVGPRAAARRSRATRPADDRGARRTASGRLVD